MSPVKEAEVNNRHEKPEESSPWAKSQIKAAQSEIKSHEKEAEKFRKEFEKNGTSEQCTEVALAHSNMIDLLKEAKIIDAAAIGFTMKDVRKYSDTVDASLNKVEFYDAKGKHANGRIERGRGVESHYDESDLRIAVRQALISPDKMLPDGITTKALRDFAVHNLNGKPKAMVMGEAMVASVDSVVGSSLKATLEKESPAAVTEAKQKILDLEPHVLAENFTSTVKPIKDADAKIAEIEKNRLAAVTTRASAEAAETAELAKKRQEFSDALKTIRDSKEFKNPKVNDTDIVKSVNDLSSSLDKTDFDVIKGYQDLSAAVLSTRIAHSHPSKTIDPVTQQPKMVMSKKDPAASLILLIAGSKDGVQPGILAHFADSMPGLVSATATARTSEQSATDKAAQDIAAVGAELKSKIASAAEEDAKKGDFRLKYALEHQRTISEKVDGKEQSVTAYPVLTKEQAAFRNNPITVQYEAAFKRLNVAAEANIVKINDPFLNSKLAEAKEREGKFQDGDRQTFFKQISEKEVKAYLKTAEDNALKGKSGKEKGEAEKTFKAFKKDFETAAGYIDFNYARQTIETVNGPAQTLTGKESAITAHFKTAARYKKLGEEGLSLRTGVDREYEDIGIGKNRYRHELHGAAYGPKELSINYDEQLAKTGTSALEAYNAAVSDMAGKALGGYTQGMQRHQHNLAGFLRRNSNITEDALQVGIFLGEQWIGSRILGSLLHHTTTHIISGQTTGDVGGSPVSGGGGSTY